MKFKMTEKSVILSDKFKEIEIWKNQAAILELKNVVDIPKNASKSLSRIDQAEERISELKDRPKNTQRRLN